jgi:hypothetical protein
MLRGNLAEAVLELSGAVSSDHDWVLSRFQTVATRALERARREQPPRFGLWRRCEAERELLPSPRIAPACCQLDSCMYVFGGVCPEFACGGCGELGTTYLSVINTALGVATPDAPLADLWCYTFHNHKWIALESKDAAPPPRGFGLLTHYDGALYLCGGRVTWSSASASYTDLWRYVLVEHRWERIAGDHPSLRSAGPHGTHGNGWCICDTGGGQPKVRRFDFESAGWSILAPTTSAVPQANSDLPSASGWLVGDSLWVYMVEAQTTVHAAESRLWEVKLSRGSCFWQPHTLAGQSTTCPRFKGSVSFPCAESSACFDYESCKGYIFGGWTHDLMSFAATPDGTASLLHGRYFNVVIEVDIDTQVIRTVETALAGMSGPSPRGFAGIAACGGRLTVFGGYTTFSKAAGRFVSVRTCSDYWVCRVLSADETKLADPTDSLNRNMATITTVNYADVSTSLRVAVLRDERLRKRISELCEPLPGALLGVMTGSGGAPLSEEEFYAAGHLRWMPREAILEHLPDLKRRYRDVYDSLFEATNYTVKATVLYVADYSEHGRLKVPYEAWATWFGRWKPNTLYLSEKALASGELKLSAEETAPPVSDVVKIIGRIQICSFLGCHTHTLAAFQSGVNGGNQTAALSKKLLVCSRCSMVKYCSVECQRADWPQHKACCKRA